MEGGIPLRGIEKVSLQRSDADGIVISDPCCPHCHQIAVVDVKQVAKWIGKSPRNVFLMVSKGEFPQPIKIGNATRWVVFVVNEWIQQQMQACA